VHLRRLRQHPVQVEQARPDAVWKSQAHGPER
jgi:hypothetical protein